MKKILITLLVVTSLLLTNCKNESKEKIVSTEKPEKKPIENPETASLTIEGMTCEIGCAKTIESKLANLDGVESAKVDFESKIATIVYDSKVQNKESLVKTVEAVAGGDTYKVSDAKIETKKG